MTFSFRAWAAASSAIMRAEGRPSRGVSGEFRGEMLRNARTEGRVRAPHRRLAELPRVPHAVPSVCVVYRGPGRESLNRESGGPAVNRESAGHRAAARVAVQSIVSWCGLKGPNEVERRVFRGARRDDIAETRVGRPSALDLFGRGAEQSAHERGRRQPRRDRSRHRDAPTRRPHRDGRARTRHRTAAQVPSSCSRSTSDLTSATTGIPCARANTAP